MGKIYTDRRRFVQGGIAATGMIALGAKASLAALPEDEEGASRYQGTLNQISDMDLIYGSPTAWETGLKETGRIQL